MPLTKQYPADFERIWKAYPKWPTGRSKKEPSFKAFAKAKKDLQFTQSDIDFLVNEIQRRTKDCENWQKGNKFGPEMFSTFFNQHRWNEPYQKVRGHVEHNPTIGLQVSDEDNQRIFWTAEHAAGRPVPEQYQHLVSH